ncbi:MULTISPECIES: hypothetical protein [Streptomyces]|uniref:Uncharacterized protein n=1 Tax=Streptomyces tsukubensis (strain DSM 42081 / NBRC 108919 / NRRL 18488 / 9993) TaxID=1114943 RepID=I2MXD4_STRT9|nr:MULTISPECIES: hypothetical protein [Streptomyces]AZK93814.1 hypothetical protein B7R87_07925 [Streptomyces tsukubensis]EIF89431.1 hypothetical protein [Streptomyces tsukubensis NRRL18488]MYS67302.1 hypothetical protein [Streptomyces sp. SID5473]QKM70051.1 hypothetical protein STSU_025900 [Streptomyces tsukubensis NRRL18488]TAI45972.1 hypothetical protein EWI31_02270 [Streptomyces tsukubensis]
MRLVEWDRRFKLWNYAFSYSQLLLRAVPKDDSDTRIDVLFSNVRHMNTPAYFDRLEIDRGDIERDRELLGITEVPDLPFEVFILNQGLGFVLATHCQWHEDNEWVDAPSHFGPFRQVK